MNIILTGASKGIGYQTALSLCDQNINNLVVIARDGNLLNKLKAECKQRNSSVAVTTIAEDLSTIVKNKDQFLEKIPFHQLDILINNAGFLVRKPFLEIEESAIFKMFEMNVLVPGKLMRILFDCMKKSPSSHVVNIGSMAGFQGSSKYPGLSYYSASKAALACLTESLAREFSQTPVKINCLAIGAVQTEMLQEAFPGYKAPLLPDEMGRFIADFALNGHKYFNGQIIPVTLSNP
jgi:short-subunit dehydrogenase